VQLVRAPNVLLVEDDYGFRTLLKALLAGAGLAVDEATSCDDGLDRSAASDYGVIILDLTPDETECQRFLAALVDRCQRTGKRPMVIAMTTPDSGEWSEDDLVALTFRKPFNARDLVDVVAGYVANLMQPPASG
jgi:DNA-binding response OmpR family regulator